MSNSLYTFFRKAKPFVNQLSDEVKENNENLLCTQQNYRNRENHGR